MLFCRKKKQEDPERTQKRLDRLKRKIEELKQIETTLESELSYDEKDKRIKVVLQFLCLQ